VQRTTRGQIQKVDDQDPQRYADITANLSADVGRQVSLLTAQEPVLLHHRLDDGKRWSHSGRCRSSISFLLFIVALGHPIEIPHDGIAAAEAEVFVFGLLASERSDQLGFIGELVLRLKVFLAATVANDLKNFSSSHSSLPHFRKAN